MKLTRVLGFVGVLTWCGLAIAQPANDTCATAEAIAISAGASGSVFGDHELATNDTAPACQLSSSAGSGTKGVWFTFTGTGNIVSFNTCGTSRDLVLRAYCGGCAALSCAASDDDGCEPPNNTGAKLALCTAPGVTYHILLSRFGGTSGSGGPFTLEWSDSGAGCPANARPACGGPAPANDTCAGAVPLSAGVPLLGTTINATPDSIPSCGGVSAGSGVWYSFTGTGGNIVIDTCSANTGSNTRVLIFSGACGSLVCQNGATSGACGARTDSASTFAFCTTAGASYFVLVSSDSNGAGLFEVSLTGGPCIPPPPNDDCANAATIVPGVPQTVDTSFARNEFGVFSCGGLSTFNQGAWYTFTPSATRSYTVSTCNSATAFDTRLYVYNGACDSSGGTVAGPICTDANATDPACTDRPDAASVTFCALGGRPYFILITGDPVGGGLATITLTDNGPGCGAPGDTCAEALAINVGDSVTGNSNTASDDVGIPACGGLTLTAFNNGVWYTFTEGASARRLAATTCDASAATQYDTRVFVYRGACGGLICVDANDDALVPCTINREDEARVEFCTTPGTTYYLLITNGEFSDDGGLYGFELTDTGLGGCTGGGDGACCNGSTCSVISQAACAGANTRFAGAGTACNAPGNIVTPCCKADFNQIGGVTVQDVFDFLAAWFSGDLQADFSGLGGVTVQDIFDFLAGWFSGC